MLTSKQMYCFQEFKIQLVRVAVGRVTYAGLIQTSRSMVGSTGNSASSQTTSLQQKAIITFLYRFFDYFTVCPRQYKHFSPLFKHFLHLFFPSLYALKILLIRDLINTSWFGFFFFLFFFFAGGGESGHTAAARGILVPDQGWNPRAPCSGSGEF